MKLYTSLFESIISMESLLDAWYQFKQGKRKRKDVQDFEYDLEKNLFSLHRALKNKSYQHGNYESFFIHDPKCRHIQKAQVADRIIHQAVYTYLVRIFDSRFISHSYSCRIGKGTHKAVEYAEICARKVSKNYIGHCFALKCDIKKFFDGVDHQKLLQILRKTIHDSKMLWLLGIIIQSFCVESFPRPRGLPIRNITSQVFTNIYLNELDQFVKNILQEKYYVRYADDFIIFRSSIQELQLLIPVIEQFLQEKLTLQLHPQKLEIRKFSQGIDFLGYVLRPHHKILRTKTKQRMFKKLNVRFQEYFGGKIQGDEFHQTKNSYLGVLSHANTFRLASEIKTAYWIGGLDNK